MGDSTEELNTEIAGTRESLGENLDALQDRVSPQAIMDRRRAAVRTRAQSLRSNVMGSPYTTTAYDSQESGGVQSKVEGSPITAGAAAFFAGMLVSAAIPATKAEAKLSQQAIDTAKEHGVTDALKSSGQDMASELKDSGQQAVQEIKDSTQESAQRVKDESQH